MVGAWQELADGVYTRTEGDVRVNVGLVLGHERCLVVDTGGTLIEGNALAAGVRARTDLPWVLVNTHAHWDHCYGNAAFGHAPIWGHEACLRALTRDGQRAKDAVVASYLDAGRVAYAAALDEVPLVPPTSTLRESVTLDLGGRDVALSHLGRGHTDGDVIVEVPDVDVVFAGDLLEQGAAPDFDDAYPLEWPATLTRLVPRLRGRVVPGHGAVVDATFAREQAEVHEAVARLATSAYAEGREIEQAAPQLPLPPAAARSALQRTYRQLATGDLGGGTPVRA